MRGTNTREYSRGPRKDAARHLSMMARRYVDNRATEKEVSDAILLWNVAILETTALEKVALEKKR